MRRDRNTRSQANICKQLDRSSSQRMFYINKQLSNSKDIHTIFHSPFKDGKKNNKFTNPTFLSSHLFYPEQQVKKQQTPKKNLVYNRNQRSRKQLYEKRMQKADAITNAIHQAAANDIANRSRTKKANDQTQPPVSRSRSNVRGDKTQQLVRQLDNLIRHRQLDQKKQRESRAYTETYYDNILNQKPIYSQKNRAQLQQRFMDDSKRNLQEWIAISERIRQMRESGYQENRRVQTKATDSFLIDNAQRKFQNQMQSRRNAGMLGNILRQQIKQSQIRKEREKRQRYNFN